MSTTRRIITASLAVAAAAALSACDADQIGAAVVVDGDQFTVAELQDAVKEIQSLEGFDVEAIGGMSTFQRDLLTRHIQHEIFLDLAAREDIEITPAEIDTTIEEYESQAPEGELAPLLAQNGYTEEAFRDGVTDQLIAEAYIEKTGGDQAALTEELRAAGEELGVEVNPRYGTWGEDLAVTAESGSISEPVGGDASEAAQPELGQ